MKKPRQVTRRKNSKKLSSSPEKSITRRWTNFDLPRVKSRGNLSDFTLTFRLNFMYEKARNQLEKDFEQWFQIMVQEKGSDISTQSIPAFGSNLAPTKLTDKLHVASGSEKSSAPQQIIKKQNYLPDPPTQTATTRADFSNASSSIKGSVLGQSRLTVNEASLVSKIENQKDPEVKKNLEAFLLARQRIKEQNQ